MYRFMSIILFISICLNISVRGKEEVQKSNSVDDVINYLITKNNFNKSLKGVNTESDSFVTEMLEESDALTSGVSESNLISNGVPIDDSGNDQTLSQLETEMLILSPLADAEITTLNPNEDVNVLNQTIISQEVLLEIMDFIASLKYKNIQVENLLNEIESNKNALQKNDASLNDFQTIQKSNQIVMDGLVNLLTTITYSEDGKSFSSPQVENLRKHLLQLEESSQLVTSEITYLHNVLSSLTNDVQSLKKQSEELKSMVLEASQGYKAVENIFQELSLTKHSMNVLLHEIRAMRLQG